MSAKETAERTPWQVDVDVHVYDEKADPPFRIESYLQTSAGGKLQFHNRGRHGFIVNFHLHDETGRGYKFPMPNELAKALRSQPGTSCPPKTCGQWQEFTADRIIQNRSVLVVRNLNETKTEFWYALCVTDDDGKTYRDLDPGGDNWNGNWNLM